MQSKQERYSPSLSSRLTARSGVCRGIEGERSALLSRLETALALYQGTALAGPLRAPEDEGFPQFPVEA
jgi:hypothetical protein